MRLRRSSGIRLNRTVLLGTACLLSSFGSASAQDAASNAVSCLTGLACNASGANIAQLQPIVDKVVGQALLNMQPAGGNAPTLSAIVGVSWKGQRAYFGYGRNAAAYKPDTIVELGSITKVFTTALLAEAVPERNVNLDEKLSTYESAIGLTSLTPCGGQVTLKQLASFSAGVPYEPDNLPYANHLYDGVQNYTISQFKNWVSGYNPTGTNVYTQTCPQSYPYLYSNASIGLVGYIVASQFGEPWVKLISDKIVHPLGMSSTFVPDTSGSVPPGLAPRVAVGRGSNYQSVSPWPYFAWYAAGVLRSDASDVLSFGEAGLGNKEINGSAPPAQMQSAVTALEKAIKLARTTTYPAYSNTGKLLFNQGLAWVETLVPPGSGYVPLWLKDGGTDGFSTTINLNVAKDLAIFIAVGQTNVSVQPLAVQLSRAIGSN